MEKKHIEDYAELIYSFRPDEAYTVEEILAQMNVWGAEVRSFKRGEKCLRAGASAAKFLLLLRGILHRRIPTTIGEDIVVGVINPGEYAGVSSVFARGKVCHSVDVVAQDDSEVVFFDVARVKANRHDPKLGPLFDYLGAMVRDLLVKSREQEFVLSGMNIAERLRRYVSMQMVKTGSRTIIAPGKEDDLAHYLGVNKCAMSRVIGRLRKEGKIKYDRNVITVLDWFDDVCDARTKGRGRTKKAST